MISKVLKLPLLLLFFAFALNADAQCGAVISTFPYNEGFESAPAWTSGGTNSDWAWGAPTHPTISAAGGGSKCWTVGGLSGSFYNYSEQSWIMSPCFDFTTLNYPWISFKIFWEDEWKYDGLVLQYSLNSGSTWANVGAFGDPVNCLNENWYNYANVSWLTSASPQCGWTGRTGPTSGSCQGGNGSLGWVTAKHCMSALAGEPNVRFRFYFGSGTTCNNFDGISIDDILISNAPPNTADFTYTCGGANVATGAYTINFSSMATPCATSYLWDFGDTYQSTLPNPSHTYANVGNTFSVTLTTSGPCNAPATVTHPVSILGIELAIYSITCHGASDGSIIANAVGGGPGSYTWSPGGMTTSTVTGLAPATYTLTATAPGSCTATTTILITEPPPITASTAVTPVTCIGNNGTATVTASGGTLPYSYSWTGTPATGASVSGLPTGSYTVTVTDHNNCSATATAVIASVSSSLTIALTSTPVSCFGGSNATAITTVTGGTAPYSFAWTPAVSAAATASGLTAGSYNVTVSDANGCTASSNTTITEPTSALAASTSSHPSSCGLPNGSASTIASGGTAPYSYSWSSPATETTSSITGLSPGTYTVTVHDANGCSVAPTATVTDSGAVAVSIISTPVSCYGTSTGSVSAEMTGGTAPYTYQWTNGQTAAHLNNITAGNYCVKIIDANGCHDSTCLNLPQPPAVDAAFTFDPAVAELDNPLIRFTDQTFNSVSWSWNFGDLSTSSATNPSHAYTTEGTYPVTLVVTNAQGCTDSVTHDIIINDGFTFFAPNAFTPNSNGNNDVFLPKGSDWDPAQYNLWIFDRWGNMLFYTTDPAKGWDGKTKSSNDNDLTDVYVWKVQLRDLRGNLKIYIGSVTLVH